MSWLVTREYRDGRRAAVLATLLGSIIACNFVLKPVRSALFLNRLGAERLPYVYLLVAVVLGIVATGFARIAGRRTVIQLIVGASAFFSANLVVFYWVFPRGGELLPYVFYVWVSVFVVAMPSLFWLLANHVVYPHEAKRLFGTTTAGGLAGSILGGGATALLVTSTGTRGLLLVAAALTAFTGALAYGIWRSEEDRIRTLLADETRRLRRRRARNEGVVATLVRSPYLTTVALLLGVTSVASTLVDFQFNNLAQHAFATEDGLTGFFGTFLAGLNALALFVQLVFAGRLVQWGGVGALLMVMPLGIAAGAFSVVLWPSLWTAAFLMFADGSLSNTFHRSGIEILYLPVPLETKTRIKFWIDMVVDRVGRGVAGLLILGMTAGLGFAGVSVSYLLVALALPWLFLTRKLARDYVEAFRESLTRRDLDVGRLAEEIRDPESVAVLRQFLTGTDERQLLYALELSRSAAAPSLESAVVALLEHSSAPVRRAALRSLHELDVVTARDEVRSLAADPDPSVRAEALAVLMKHGDPEGERGLLAFLTSHDAALMSAAVDGLQSSPGLVQAVGRALDEAIEKFSRSSLDAERALAARAAGLRPDSPRARAVLSHLLADSSTAVAKAAVAATANLSPAGLAPLVPVLLETLRKPRLSALARTALSRCGDAVVPALSARLTSAEEDVATRGAAARALADIESQRALDELLSSLPQEDPYLHHRVIKALGKMRARFGTLAFDRKRIDVLLSLEAFAAYEVASERTALGRREEPSFKLLLRALEERQSARIERLFRFLGLLHPPRDLFNAWFAVAHGSTAIRAAALEFLENLLSSEHRKKILPLLLDTRPEAVSEAGRSLFGLPELDFAAALRRLIAGKDAWLAACALTVAGDLRLTALRKEVENATAHQSRAPREAAGAARARLAG